MLMSPKSKRPKLTPLHDCSVGSSNLLVIIQPHHGPLTPGQNPMFLYPCCLLILWPAKFQELELIASFLTPPSSLPKPIRLSPPTKASCNLPLFLFPLPLPQGKPTCLASDLDCIHSRLFASLISINPSH